jgi:drug/metabolite transporter (DMT)-like permease
MNISAMRMGSKEWTLLLALSVIWGGSFFLFKVLLRELPPFTIVFGRVAIAAIALNGFLLWRGVAMPWNLGIWRRFMLMGVLNNIVPFSLILFGETRIASGLASILNATTPIFAVLVAHVVGGDERLTTQKTIGVSFAMLGVLLLVGPGVVVGSAGFDLLGEAACLLAAFSYALAGIYGRRFRNLAPIQLATGQITASTILLTPVVCVADQPWNLPMPGIDTWLALLALALLCTALAYIIYFKVLAAAGATNVMLVTFLVPISALMLGALFLNERVTAMAVGGMLLIGLGLASIDGRVASALWRRES